MLLDGVCQWCFTVSMTTESSTYNGWTNYETWNVKLWLDNDEGSYNMLREMAEDAKTAEYPKAQLSNALKDLVEENAPDLGASMYADLLGAAISDVNWYEIAENILSES